MSNRCRSPTGSLEVCRWLEMPRTTTSIHDKDNVFDGHENASETRKMEAKLARCLLRTEGRTNQVSCEHDTCWRQSKTREEQHRFPRCIPGISRGAYRVVCWSVAGFFEPLPGRGTASKKVVLRSFYMEAHERSLDGGAMSLWSGNSVLP